MSLGQGLPQSLPTTVPLIAAENSSPAMLNLYGMSFPIEEEEPIETVSSEIEDSTWIDYSFVSKKFNADKKMMAYKAQVRSEMKVIQDTDSCSSWDSTTPPPTFDELKVVGKNIVDFVFKAPSSSKDSAVVVSPEKTVPQVSSETMCVPLCLIETDLDSVFVEDPCVTKFVAASPSTELRVLPPTFDELEVVGKNVCVSGSVIIYSDEEIELPKSTVQQYLDTSSEESCSDDDELLFAAPEICDLCDLIHSHPSEFCLPRFVLALSRDNPEWCHEPYHFLTAYADAVLGMTVSKKNKKEIRKLAALHVVEYCMCDDCCDDSRKNFILTVSHKMSKPKTLVQSNFMHTTKKALDATIFNIDNVVPPLYGPGDALYMLKKIPLKNRRSIAYQACKKYAKDNLIALDLKWPKGSAQVWEDKLEEIKIPVAELGDAQILWTQEQTDNPYFKEDSEEEKVPDTEDCSVCGREKEQGEECECKKGELSQAQIDRRNKLMKELNKVTGLKGGAFSTFSRALQVINLPANVALDSQLFNRFILDEEPIPGGLSPEDIIAAALRVGARAYNVLPDSPSGAVWFNDLSFAHPTSTIISGIQRLLNRVAHTNVDIMVSARVQFNNQWKRVNVQRVSVRPGAPQTEILAALRTRLDNRQADELYPGDIGDIDIISHTRIGRFNLNDIRMYGVTLHSRILEKLAGDYQSANDGMCVPEYILRQFIGKKYMKKLTQLDILHGLQRVSGRQDGFSTKDIIRFLEDMNLDAVSVHALDCLNGNVFQRRISKSKNKVSLIFIVAHNHCYPIADKRIRDQIQAGQRSEDLREMSRTSIIVDTEDVEHISRNDQTGINELIEGTITGKVIYTNYELIELIQPIITASGYAIDQIAISDSRVTKFVHPKTGQVIVFHEHYEDCKNLCSVLKQKYPSEDFSWRGQNYTHLANTLFIIKTGALPPSTGTEAQWVFEDKFQTVPLIQRLSEKEKDEEFNSIDMNKCYLTCMYNTTQDWLVFDAGDEIKEFSINMRLSDRAQYYVTEIMNTVMGLHIPTGIMSFELVKYLISKQVIRKEDIKYYRIARKLLPKGTFRPFIDEIMKMEKDTGINKLGKMMINRFIGSTNIKDFKKECGYITQDFNEVCALFSTYDSKDNTKIVFENLGENYILRVTETNPKPERLNYIWTQVVCRATLEVIKKAFAVTDKGGVIIGIKCDALLVENIDCRELLLDDDAWKIETNTKMPLSTWCPMRDDLEYKVLEWNPVSRDTVLRVREGCLVNGIAGSGKSFLIVDIIKNILRNNSTTSICVSTFTWAALGNLRRKLKRNGVQITKGGEIEVDVARTRNTYKEMQGYNIKIPAEKLELRTISSLTFHKQNIQKSNYNWIIIDEFSMLTVENFCKLQEIQKVHGTKFIIAGDQNQCPAVDPTNPVLYKMVDSNIMKSLTNQNKLELGYRTDGKTRYDPRLFQMQDCLIRKRKLDDCFCNVVEKPDARENIVKTNATKEKTWAKHGGLKYREGQKVIADFNTLRLPNLPKIGFYQSSSYIIKHIERVDDQWCYWLGIEGKEVRIESKYFKPSSAMTVYKYQGGTIFTIYNILEADIMYFEEFYTAITRGKKYWNVRFDGNKVRGKVFKSVYDSVATVYPRKPKPYTVYEISITGNKTTIASCSTNITAVKNEVIRGYHDIITLTDIKQDQIEVESQGTFYATDESTIRKHLMKIEGRTYEYISGLANLHTANAFLDSKFKIKYQANRNRYAIRCDGVSEIRKTEEEINAIREELLETYYPSLTIGVKKPEERKVKLFSNINREVKIQRKQRLIKPEDEQPAIPPLKLPEINTDMEFYYHQNIPAYEANRTGRLLVKWVEKQGDNNRHYFTNFERDHLVDAIYKINEENKQAFLFEVLGDNVRLFCDVDLDRDELEYELEDTEILLSVLTAIKAQFDIKGETCEYTKFRVVDACTETKISYHISYLGSVFERIEHQKKFWEDTSEWCKENMEQLWFTTEHKSRGELSKCAIDGAVYTKNRAMRCVYSSKDGKKNPLIPLVWEGEWKHQNNLSRADLAEYLITAPSVTTYSKLTYIPESLKKKGKQQRYGITKRDLLDNQTKNELKQFKLPDGFEIGNADRSEQYIRLYRNNAGFCPCCNRTHHRDNAYLGKFDDQWSFGCYHSSVRVPLLVR